MQANKQKASTYKTNINISEQSKAITAPNDNEAERALLGCILTNPEKLPLVEKQMENGEAFFYLKHKYIYDAMMVLSHNGDAIDSVTVGHRLLNTGQLKDIGGPAYLTQLIRDTPTSAHIETYAGMIQRLHERRKMMKLRDDIGNIVSSPDGTVEELIGIVQEQVDSATSALASRVSVSMEELAQKHVEATDELMNTPGGKAIVKSGISSLDNILGGFEAPFVYAFVGLPHNGKTVTIMTCAVNAGINNKRVLYINCADGTEKNVLDKMSGMLSNVQTEKITHGTMSPQEYSDYHDAMRRISKLPMTVKHQKGITLREIMMLCKIMKASGGIDILFIDYFQCIDLGIGNPYDSTVDRYNYVSQKITVLAEMFDIPVVYAAQAKTAVGDRKDKRPLMTDTEYCSRVGQHVDGFIATYKPSHYDDLTVSKNAIELLVRKNKVTNRTGKVIVYHDELTGMISNKR